MKNTYPKAQTPGLNPFLPFGTYIADGEPKVFGDRVWLYGSFDRFNGGYCSKVYHAFSAPAADLSVWTDHGVSFSTDDVPWSDAELYAPDAVFLNGVYYLYFCLSDGSEGVASADRPEGPFKNAKRITLNGEPITGIDPSVLYDNGRVYYTWGQFDLRMGELADDMATLKPDTVRRDILSNADGREGFHEGSSLRKIGDRYCMIYASEYTPAWPHHGGRPTKLDYAVSDSPYGPYERRGTVIDNTGCDPESWNDHGSIIKIGEQWFVFYHASSNSSAYSRRARVERLEVDETAGTIRQARPSTNGFTKTLLPSLIGSPVHANAFFGGAYVTERENGVFPAVGITDGAGFSFSPVRFENAGYTLTLRGRFLAPSRVRLTLGDRAAAEAGIPVAAPDVTIRFKADGKDLPLKLEFLGAPQTALCEIEALRISVTQA